MEVMLSGRTCSPDSLVPASLAVTESCVHLEWPGF